MTNQIAGIVSNAFNVIVECASRANVDVFDVFMFIVACFAFVEIKIVVNEIRRHN